MSPSERDHSGRADRIQSGFAQAADLDPLARRAFLERLRSEQPDIADEIESLLTHHDGGGAAGFDEPTGSIPSSLIGAFVAGCTVERLVGYGGMSAVYAALQDFPRRRVALKIVRRERLGASARRRLRVEAEALARLQHPGIARVFAAGAERLSVDAEHESPYIVMEFIDGALPLTRWADRQGLDARERLALLVDIADAIDHAHAAGVIHRDLKPGNVIVGHDGVPRVIDFGIAAVANPSVTAATDAPMGTLAYMSPEQARGEPVDVRSDVWGLGALGYDLLVGRPPFEVQGRALAEHVDRLLHDRVQQVGPGARAAGRSEAFLRSMPVGTNDVLGKALATEPGERYRSARELADDLRRLLSGESLAARPDSSWRASRRFVRRHRVLAGAVTAVASVGTAALVMTSVALERANDAAYANAIWAAWGMLERNDASAAHDMLVSVDGARRGWEWRHLAARCDQSVWTTPAPGQVYGVEWCEPDRVLATAGSEFLCLDGRTGDVRWRTDLRDGVAWRVVGAADGGAVGVLHTTAVVSLDADGHECARMVIDGAHDLAALPGRREVAVLREEYVQVLDAVTLAERERLAPALPAVARELSIAPDASVMAMGDMSGHVSLVERDGRVRWSVRVPGAPEVIGTAFSSDGSMVAAVGGPSVALLSTADGSVRWVSTTGRNGARSACFTPDGLSVLVGGWTEAIERIWVADGASEAFISGAFSQVWSLAPEPGGTNVVAGSFRGVIQRFPMDAQMTIARQRIGEGSLLSLVPVGSDRVRATSVVGDEAVCAADGRMELVGSHEAVRGSIAAWRGADGVELAIEPPTDAAGQRVRDVSSRDGWTGVVWGNGVMAIYAPGQRAPRFTARGAGRGARAPLVDPARSRAIMFRGSEGPTEAVDLRSGATSVVPFRIEHPSVGALSPDGRLLAIGSMDRDAEVMLLDAATLKVLHRCAGHRSPVTALAWLDDGSRLASASSDGTVRVWQTTTMREALTPMAVLAYALAWTDDGTLWAAGADGAVYRAQVR
jgi:WD40 repeat protein/tRNA A-37 threonylcarbamoyl transferase component Bud32